MAMVRRSALIAAAVALGLAGAARADDRDDRNDRSDWDRRGRSSYEWRVERVAALAHEVEEATERINRTAQSRRGYLSWEEARALRRLDLLEERARHFHQQVERRRTNPRHTEGDFQALVASYQRAEGAVDDLRGWPRVRREFRRLTPLMSELEQCYAQASYRRGPNDGHRYGEGR